MLTEGPCHVEGRLASLGHILGIRGPVLLEGLAWHGARSGAVDPSNSYNGVPRALGAALAVRQRRGH